VYDPAFKKKKGRPSAKEICEDLIRQNRADFIAPADYTRNSKLFRIVKVLVNRIVEEEKLKKFKVR
jgi:hypothetical protein